jgi:hypothetical protein
MPQDSNAPCESTPTALVTSCPYELQTMHMAARSLKLLVMAYRVPNRDRHNTLHTAYEQ